MTNVPDHHFQIYHLAAMSTPSHLLLPLPRFFSWQGGRLRWSSILHNQDWRKVYPTKSRPGATSPPLNISVSLTHPKTKSTLPDKILPNQLMARAPSLRVPPRSTENSSIDSETLTSSTLAPPTAPLTHFTCEATSLVHPPPPSPVIQPPSSPTVPTPKIATRSGRVIQCPARYSD